MEIIIPDKAPFKAAVKPCTTPTAAPRGGAARADRGHAMNLSRSMKVLDFLLERALACLCWPWS